MIQNFSILMLILLSVSLKAQTRIDVAESTLKVAGVSEEVFYYGFAEGDQLIFNFEEVNGKELKEIEIMEMPSSSKFMDYKTKNIIDKTINISRSGVYSFRFANSSLAGRVCKFKLQRVPASDATKNFNTSVFWRNVIDSVISPVQERYLIRSDTSDLEIADQLTRVPSSTALNGSSNRTIVEFTLPENTISWSYYIGVGNEGKEAFKAAGTQFITAAAKTAIKLPGGAMSALALYGLNYFNQVQGADNVQFHFLSDWNSVLLFKSGNRFYQYKTGNVLNDASRMTVPLIGKVYLGLYNDNILEPIDVLIKATAILVKQEWGIREVQKLYTTSRKEAYLKN